MQIELYCIKNTTSEVRVTRKTNMDSHIMAYKESLGDFLEKILRWEDHTDPDTGIKGA
jgi:hypothetical protein